MFPDHFRHHLERSLAFEQQDPCVCAGHEPFGEIPGAAGVVQDHFYIIVAEDGFLNERGNSGPDSVAGPETGMF